MEWTDSALRDYLLGSSSPEAAERIEARVIEDEELFTALRSAEDDLFDACARGRLAPAERARFLERYGQHADRLRFAAALAHRTAGAPSSGSRRTWISLAAAAVLVLAAGALFTQLEAPSSPPASRVEPQAPVASGQQPPTAPQPPSIFAVTVALGTSRAAAASTAVAIPAGVSTVQLTVQLDPADRFSTYSMDIRGAGDRVAWSGADLTSATVDGHLMVSAGIPATALPAGSYVLAVRGAGTDLGFVSLTVRWSP